MTNSETYTKTIGIVLSAVPGYSETFFRNKIKGLQDNGIEIILFVDYPSDQITDLNCKVVVAPKFNSSLLSKFAWSFNAFVKSVFVNPKASLTHLKLDKKDGLTFKQRCKNLFRNQFLLNNKLDWLHFGYGMLASNRENVAQAINAKMAVSFRGFDLYLSPLKHNNCYKNLFSKTVKYHVLSNKMKERLEEYEIPKDHINVITPAINTNLFNLEHSESNSATLEILCVSRLHWVKGIHYLLEALSFLKSENVDFRLTIIGDGSEKERLIFAAYQYGILDQVAFTGKLTQDQVITYYKSANLYIQYSIQEGFGNAVLEAQAMGLLCIVSDADGLQQNVLNEKTGWVVPKRDPIALAKKIKEVHHLPLEKKQSVTHTAVNRVKDEFNLELQNKLFLEFYAE